MLLQAVTVVLLLQWCCCYSGAAVTVVLLLLWCCYYCGAAVTVVLLKVNTYIHANVRTLHTHTHTHLHYLRVCLCVKYILWVQNLVIMRTTFGISHKDTKCTELVQYRFL